MTAAAASSEVDKVTAALSDADSAPSIPPIDRAEQLLVDRLGHDCDAAERIALAAQHARSLVAAGSDAGSAHPNVLGLVALLSEVFPELWLELQGNREEIRGLVDAAIEPLGPPPDAIRLQLLQRVVMSHALLELPPDLALETALGIVCVLGAARHVSLWEVDSRRRLVCTAHVGGPPSKRGRELARRTLDGAAAELANGVLTAVPVNRWERPRAVLVGRSDPGTRSRCVAVLGETARMIDSILERRLLLETSGAREASLTLSSERRLTRLAFDLHDGPLQNAAGIAGDLRMLRRRLSGVLPAGSERKLILGCVDDIEGRLNALQAELRDLSHAFESPAMLKRSLGDVLRRTADAFRRRTDIRLALDIHGDFTDLTASQQIAIVRVVQEALSNVREHSGAQEVTLTITGKRDRLVADVTDDGRGFAVEPTLLDAAERGRLGLVGVGERVRLLGGRCDIISRPGGPTKILVNLPRWRPPRPGPTRTQG
jgi:signal transduction histidine kinase